jgi:hypothetical protein
MPSLPALRSQRDAILGCAQKHGAVAVRIFGSVSRGEEGGDSDVDFLVGFELERSLIDQIALIQDLGALLGASVDVVDEGGLSPDIRTQILQEAVPL